MTHPTHRITDPQILTAIQNLDNALHHIRTHPEEWDQTLWIGTPTKHDHCGTTACIAGRVAIQNGWTPDTTNSSVTDDRNGHLRATYTHVTKEPHQTGAVIDIAQDILWLDNNQAETLFSPDNTIHDLHTIRNEIVKHWEQTETNVEWVSVAVSGADGEGDGT